MKTYDIAIIGSGVTGSALAAKLANTNRSVALIEQRFCEQDRIVGELMQPAGVNLLVKMGFGDVFGKIAAQTVDGYTLVQPDETIHIPYNTEKGLGYGMRNGKLITALREKAMPAENIFPIEARALSLTYANDRVVGCSVQTKDGEEKLVYAKHTVVADGFYSKLRGDFHSKKAKNTGYFAGLLLQGELPQAKHGYILNPPGGCVLMYPVAPHTIRILIGWKGQRPSAKNEAFTKYCRETLPQLLPTALVSCFLKAFDEQRLQVMPTQWLPAYRKKTVNGLLTMGDAMNMRHPLTGAGMTVGLTDVYHLSQLLLSDIDAIDEQATRYYKQRPALVGNLNILANALYQVMMHPKLNKTLFAYLGEGGAKAQEPIDILAGHNGSRSHLLKHFFAVAAQEVNQQPNDWMAQWRERIHTLTDASRIIYPYLVNS